MRCSRSCPRRCAHLWSPGPGYGGEAPTPPAAGRSNDVVSVVRAVGANGDQPAPATSLGGDQGVGDDPSSAATFRCAFTPPSDFNVRVSATRSPRPARCASAIVGANPAHETKLASSKTVEMAGKL